MKEVNMVMKKCSLCKNEKDESNFGKIKGKIRSHCNNCRKETRRLKQKQSDKLTRIDRSNDTNTLKTCTKCKILKLRVTNFCNRDSWCKDCKKEAYRNKQLSMGFNLKFIPKVDGNFKQCVRCKLMLESTNYYPSKRGKLRVSSYCKKCTSAIRLTKVNYLEKGRIQSKKYRDNNREKWRAQHRIH